MSDLSNCTRCDWRYPSELLQPVIGSTLHKGAVCGLCALEMINAIHGMRRARFDGEMAEDIRLRAKRWRKKHPECQPVEVQW